MIASSPALSVLKTGLQATIQDAGRYGYQYLGVAPAGAMDPIHFRIANALVGCELTCPVIEFSVTGLTIRVEAESVRIGVSGDFPISIDGCPTLNGYRSFAATFGQVVEIGASPTMARGYLSVANGLMVTPTLGSVATHTSSGLGGLTGDVLRPGDRIGLIRPAVDLMVPDVCFDPDRLPPASHECRIILGPQEDFFDPQATADFLASPYTVALKSDRMGYYLSGAKIPAIRGHDIVSDALTLGSIQIAGSGDPLILLADHQTMGGYPKIATVISADIPMVSQRRPGDVIKFVAVELEEAYAARALLHEFYEELPRMITPLRRNVFAMSSEDLLFHNLIDGVVDAVAR